MHILYYPYCLQGEVWTDCRYLGVLRCDYSLITTCGLDVKLPPRKALRSDPRKNLADQSTITKYRAGQHRIDCRSSDRASRLFQRELRQEGRSLVKKIGHRLEPRRDYTADVVAASGNDVKSHRRAEVHDDGGTTVKRCNGRGIRQAVGSDCFRSRVINPHAKFHGRI